MTQLPIKVMAFFGAYAPLFAIYGIRAIPINLYLALALGVAAVVFPIIVVAYVQQSRKDANAESTPVAGVARRDDQIMAYLFTYVLPFVGLAFSDFYEVAASAVFLLVLFVLYIRTNLFYVNPVLGAVGYRVYEIQIDNAPARIVLSKAPFIKVGEPLRLVRLLDEDVFLDLGGKKA